MESLWRRIVETLRRDFIAGLLIIVPVGFTILAIVWGVDQLDKLVLPKLFNFIGMEAKQPPLVGVMATLCLILLAGALTRSFLGRSFIRVWERAIDRVPIARSLYSVLKQFMEAIFGSAGREGFNRVVLIEYPRRDIWCYAFTTGEFRGTVPGLRDGLTQIFIPSTPNPTTGYFLLVPEADLILTDLTIEAAFKVIISAGIASGAEQ
jgi:uncharacterized membrane protein